MLKISPDIYRDTPSSPWAGLSGNMGSQPGGAPTQQIAPQPAMPPAPQGPYPTFPNAAGVGSQKGYEAPPPVANPQNVVPTVQQAQTSPWSLLAKAFSSQGNFA